MASDSAAGAYEGNFKMLPHDNETGPDLSRSSFYFYFHIFIFLFIPCQARCQPSDNGGRFPQILDLFQGLKIGALTAV